MATTIKLKNGSGAPLAGDLVQGEPALDLTNKRLYTEDSGGTVIEVGTNPSTIDINAGTIDGTVIGGSSAAAGTFTTFTSTGIDDNATSTAITIDSSENVGIGTSDANPYSLASTGTTLALDSTSASVGALVSLETAGVKRGYLFANSQNIVLSAVDASIPLLFKTNDTERMRIDSSGNVGIGTASPNEKLVSNGAIRATGAATNIANADGALLDYAFGFARLTAGSAASSVGITFNTAVSGTPAERMRIDSSGNLLVGTTSTGSLGSNFRVLGSGANAVASVERAGTLANSGQVSLYILGNAGEANQTQASLIIYKHAGITNPCGAINLEQQNGTQKYLWSDDSGNFRISSTATNIGTTTGTVVGTQTSDERLKDIEPTFEYGLDHVMQLNPIAYTRNDEENSVRKLGFGAQTTQTVVPEVVYDTGECIDGYDVDPDDSMVQTPKSDDTKLAMEYVQLIPVLTKAIQEQQAMIEDLKAEVAALKGA